MNASDADTGRNRIVTYAIPNGADQGMVAINPSTGVIRAQGSFDFEKEQIYEFPLLAKDRGVPPRTGTAVLRVSIVDMNDETPEFVQSVYNFEVEENMHISTVVGRVAATDKDTAPFNKIKFSIDSFYGGMDAFNIDEDTGEITTVAVLDREKKEKYNLVIVATNEDNPQMRNSINTSVFVLDQNDNDCEFEFPSDRNYIVHIANDLAIGSHVTTIIASDPDEGDNAKLSFEWIKGNEDGFFFLNSTTGQITVSKNLGSFDYYHFTVEIVAKDHGYPTRSCSSELHIIVNRSLAVIHFHDSPGFNFMNIQNHHLIAGTIVVILLVFILTIVIFIVRYKQRGQSSGANYKSTKEMKKRDTTRKDMNGEWKPVPSYSVEVNSVDTLKPKKNVKFLVDSENMKPFDSGHTIETGVNI